LDTGAITPHDKALTQDCLAYSLSMGDSFDAGDAQLAEFAVLLRERNSIGARIGAILNRPASVGNIGEWIAAKVFDIELTAAANNAAFDGHFTTGSLMGRTVNSRLTGGKKACSM